MFKLGVALVGSFVAGQAVTIASYCQNLETICYATHGLNASVCATGMADYGESSTTTDRDVDSLGCRQYYLLNTTLQLATRCQYGGPSGGGRCGAMHQVVCNIAETICAAETATKSYPDADECARSYFDGGIAAQWGSIQGGLSAGEDSLECRVYHVFAGVTNDAVAVHCGHYGLKNSTNAQCKGKVSTNKRHYCETLRDGCVAPYVQFALDAQCEGVAAAYPNPTTDDDARASTIGNNLGCRQYHAQAAKVLDDPQHCQHGGPSAFQGPCGNQKQAWASILNGVCNDNSALSFVNNVPPAIVDAAIPIGISGVFNDSNSYNTTFDTSKNTQICRIYHLGVAVTDSSHCSHGTIGGGGACGASDKKTNLCEFIKAVCGYGTAAHQYADASACASGVANLLPGLENATSGNTLGCRFYHTGVAATYLAGGSAGGANGNDVSLKEHCSHVLAAPTAGCIVPTVTGAPSASSDATTMTVPTIAAFMFAIAASFAL
jgi:hypothetical protein